VEHGNQATLECPGDMLGLVTVQCDDTEYTVIDGECGDMNCPNSFAYSNGAALPHRAINNGWQAGPTACPSPYEGIATFFCRNGTTEVDEVTMELPASPEDFAAVEAGNDSSEQSRFIMCGCCHPQGLPDPPPPVTAADQGILIAAAATGAALGILAATAAGAYYYYPRKKTSRIFPSGDGIVVKEPKPLKEKVYDPVFSQLALEMENNPALQQYVADDNLQLQALSLEEQEEVMNQILENPNEVGKYYNRRSVQHILAVHREANTQVVGTVVMPSPGNALYSITDIAPQPPLPPSATLAALALPPTQGMQLPSPPEPPTSPFSTEQPQPLRVLAKQDDRVPFVGAKGYYAVE